MITGTMEMSKAHAAGVRSGYKIKGHILLSGIRGARCTLCEFRIFRILGSNFIPNLHYLTPYMNNL